MFAHRSLQSLPSSRDPSPSPSRPLFIVHPLVTQQATYLILRFPPFFPASCAQPFIHAYGTANRGDITSRGGRAGQGRAGRCKLARVCALRLVGPSYPAAAATIHPQFSSLQTDSQWAASPSNSPHSFFYFAHGWANLLPSPTARAHSAVAATAFHHYRAYQYGRCTKFGGRGK